MHCLIDCLLLIAINIVSGAFQRCRKAPGKINRRPRMRISLSVWDGSLSFLPGLTFPTKGRALRQFNGIEYAHESEWRLNRLGRPDLVKCRR
jgi:hypothetical protein